MTVSEHSDWAACQQLWLLRRGRPEPKTWTPARLIRERVGEALTGKPPSQADPPVRWTPTIGERRAVGVNADLIAQAIRDKWDEIGHHPTGYHDREYRAFETCNGEAGELTWWLVDIGARPGWAVWLEVAEIAADREGTTHVGVLTCRLRAWPHDPEVTAEQREFGPIKRVLAQQVVVQERVAVFGEADRTPGLNCARCPDRQCPVRVS